MHGKEKKTEESSHWLHPGARKTGEQSLPGRASSRVRREQCSNVTHSVTIHRCPFLCSDVLLLLLLLCSLKSLDSFNGIGVLVCTNNKLFINLRGLSEAIKTTPTHRRPLVYSFSAVTSPAGHTAILDRAHHSNPLLLFTLQLHPRHPLLFKRAIKTISIWFPSLAPRFLSATVYCQPKTVTRWNCNSVLSHLLLLL